MTTSRQHCATLFTGCPCLSALRSKLRWWHMTASLADHQCTSVTSVHRSSLFPFVLGFVLLTTMTWLCHVLGLRVMVRTVSASWHLRFGTCCYLISRTVMLVANSSSRALRLGSLCKPTHKRRLWELCLSGALQILDLIDWLISTYWNDMGSAEAPWWVISVPTMICNCHCQKWLKIIKPAHLQHYWYIPGTKITGTSAPVTGSRRIASKAE